MLDISPTGRSLRLNRLYSDGPLGAAHVLSSSNRSSQHSTLYTPITRRPPLAARCFWRSAAIAAGRSGGAPATFSLFAWPEDKVSARRWGHTIPPPACWDAHRRALFLSAARSLERPCHALNGLGQDFGPRLGPPIPSSTYLLGLARRCVSASAAQPLWRLRCFSLSTLVGLLSARATSMPSSRR